MSEHPNIETGTLAEYLFNHQSLTSLEQLLAQESFDLIKRQWKLNDEQCRQQIELAMNHIRHD